MQPVEIEQTGKFTSWLESDKLAYAAVLAGSAAFMGDGLFGISRQAQSESAIWFLLAVPMLCLSVYTAVSGIRLRSEATRLGDFAEVDSYRQS